jgi:SAM-dependent methyltransferase
MPAIQPTHTSQVHQQNISYYDEIADQYDQLLQQEDANTLVRDRVKEQWLQTVTPGRVLDFGGGTGLDLGWLTTHQYQVIFCEPSAGMRQKAIHYSQQLVHGNKIQILDDAQTDFTRWQQTTPFPQRLEGVLANFGVLNAIPDIPLLFQQFSQILVTGGHCFAVILDRPLKKMWQWHRRHTISTLLLRQPFVMYVWHQGHRQTVYVHTVKEVQQAASPYFEMKEAQLIGGTSFRLLHLVKK